MSANPFRDRRISRELDQVIARVAGERPREISPRSTQPTPIGDLGNGLAFFGAKKSTTKVDRLLQLERELAELLATSAPESWRTMRRTVRRLIANARRELRAAAIADEATP